MINLLLKSKKILAKAGKIDANIMKSRFCKLLMEHAQDETFEDLLEELAWN